MTMENAPMNRFLLKSLLEWKEDFLRKPLILKGARQVGKSYLAKKLGETFESFVEINFETQIGAKKIFEGDLNAKALLQGLRAYTGKMIESGRTLLFLDEIQECENAIIALRAFKEELPGLHVIAAGSLINFKLNQIGIPVGRVEFRHVYPLSFEEYLEALGKSGLRDYKNNPENTVTEPFHSMLLEEVRHYMWLGGMPAVVNAWIKTQDPVRCQHIQDDILNAYRMDFAKYAKTHQLPYVERVFSNIPNQLGHKFKFTHVDRELRSGPLKDALLLLEEAGIAHLVYHSSAQGFPLAATKDDRRFKVFFFDMGLAQRLLNLNLSEFLFKPLEVQSAGAISEQFVAQEYLAYQDVRTKAELFYWHRESDKSNAEIDFIFVHQGKILPVEVKSGSTGRLKSMQEFLNSHPASAYGIKISEQIELAEKESAAGIIKSIPFYQIQRWA